MLTRACHHCGFDLKKTFAGNSIIFHIFTYVKITTLNSGCSALSATFLGCLLYNTADQWVPCAFFPRGSDSNFLSLRKQNVSFLVVYHKCASKYRTATRIQQTANGWPATEAAQKMSNKLKMRSLPNSLHIKRALHKLEGMYI